MRRAVQEPAGNCNQFDNVNALAQLATEANNPLDVRMNT